MRICKPSKKTGELLKGWLIYSPNVSSGPYEDYYENGRLKDKGTFVAGERDGPYESYHGNGQLWQKGTYVAGELDGPAERYCENGQLEARGTFNMGERCGEWIIEGEAQTYPPCPPA